MFSLPTLINISNVLKSVRRENMILVQNTKDSVFKEVLQRKISSLDRTIDEVQKAISTLLLEKLG